MSANDNASPNNDLLLPEAVRRRLDPLMLTGAKIRSGGVKGDRRSARRGSSIEFADYRNYVPGDDLRQLDWNIYARLEKPYVKLLEDEEDLAVHLLLDVSASMDWAPEDQAASNKLLFGRRLFAGLAYIALKLGDRLMMTAASDGGPQMFGPARGRAQVVPMLRYVHGVRASGVTDLNAVLGDYALRERRAGLFILISDMFSPTGYSAGLNRLLGKGHEVVIVQVLSPDEVTPPLAGDLRLVDVETGRGQEVTIDAGMRTLYQQRLTAWLDGIRDDCARKGVHYVMVETDMPWEKVILFELRKFGVVR